MPRIWAGTIDAHRRQVVDAVLGATAHLLREQGPMSVSMSAIAERAGVGRATLYKYFRDVESILVAWHAREFAGHLDALHALAARADPTLDDLAATVVDLRRGHAAHADDDLVAALAGTVADFDREQGTDRGRLHADALAVVGRILATLAERGLVRADVEPAVLAGWVFHGVHAPPDLDDEAVARLVVDSLRPPRRGRGAGR